MTDISKEYKVWDGKNNYRKFRSGKLLPQLFMTVDGTGSFVVVFTGGIDNTEEAGTPNTGRNPCPNESMTWCWAMAFVNNNGRFGTVTREVLGSGFDFLIVVRQRRFVS